MRSRTKSFDLCESISGWLRYSCLSPPLIFYGPFKGGASFMEPFYYIWFTFVFIILSRLFLAAL